MKKTCAWQGCDVEFETSDKRVKYHSNACRSEARRDQWRVIPATPEAAEERQLERKLLEAQRRAAVASRETREAKRQVAEGRVELDALSRELALYEQDYEPAPAWLKPPRDIREHHATLVAFLSDIHAGEVVSPDELDDFNAYDLNICERRLGRFFDRTILVARHYLAGVKYDGVVLALGGDLVSGDIHDELAQTNEASTYESVEFLVPRLRAGIEKLATEFGRVHVVSAPGNHGRDSKRPRYKGRSAHNADTHVARLLADVDREEAITFDVPRSFDVDFTVYDYRFNLEHGDALRFSGVSEIGAIGPVKRGTLRKSRQRQLEGRAFTYSLVGHFHQYVPAASQGFIMNGSLKGYDEFARGWHLTPEPAQQALAVVTPEHGITVQAPVLVEKREAEGW